MIRKLYAVVMLAMMALLMAPAVASADNPPYEAPPVTPEDPVSTIVDVVPAAQQATVPSSPLASTGAGMDIGMWLGIGAVILVVGVALTMLGTRLVASKGARH